MVENRTARRVWWIIGLILAAPMGLAGCADTGNSALYSQNMRGSSALMTDGVVERGARRFEAPRCDVQTLTLADSCSVFPRYEGL